MRVKGVYRTFFLNLAPSLFQPGRLTKRSRELRSFWGSRTSSNTNNVYKTNVLKMMVSSKKPTGTTVSVGTRGGAFGRLDMKLNIGNYPTYIRRDNPAGRTITTWSCGRAEGHLRTKGPAAAAFARAIGLSLSGYLLYFLVLRFFHYRLLEISGVCINPQLARRQPQEPRKPTRR